VQELLAHKLCEKMQLELLNQKEVQEYINLRLGGNSLVNELSSLIFQRTDGNALFVVTLTDHLLRKGLIQQKENQRLRPEAIAAIKTELPEGLQQLILKEVEGLSMEEQQVLEAASIAGLYFTAAEVAAAERKEEERIEELCDRFVQQQRLIIASGSEEWPDGTVTTGYRFVHALHRQVVSARIGSARQVRLHRLISERLETAYGARTADIANHLAVHFERGRDQRAVHYRRLAAEQALRQHAYQEVYRHSKSGLSLIETLPDTPERKQLELRLRQHVNAALSATRGFTDNELEASLRRTHQLCRELDDDTTLVSVLIGLGRLLNVRADRTAVAELAQQEERLIERLPDARLLVQLHAQLVAIAVARGLHTQAKKHFKHVLAHYDSQALSSFLLSFGGDPLLVASPWFGLSLSLAGQPEQGWSQLTQTLVRAEELNHPFALANGLFYAAMVMLLRGEYDEAWRLTQQLDALTHEHNFSLYKITAVMLRGGLAVHRSALEEGIAGMIAGLAQYRALGAQIHVPFFLSFLAEGYRQQGEIIKAQQAVNEALSLTAANLDVFWEAELYRLKGELTLAQSSVQLPASSIKTNQKARGKGQKVKVLRTQPQTLNTQAEAEACFSQAVKIARQQGAKLLELRATMSLTRLWRQQGKQHEAHDALSDIYQWFTEGFDTADLQTARMLLAQRPTLSQCSVHPPKPKG